MLRNIINRQRVTTGAIREVTMHSGKATVQTRASAPLARQRRRPVEVGQHVKGGRNGSTTAATRCLDDCCHHSALQCASAAAAATAGCQHACTSRPGLPIRLLPSGKFPFPPGPRQRDCHRCLRMPGTTYCRPSCRCCCSHAAGRASGAPYQRSTQHHRQRPYRRRRCRPHLLPER